MSEPEHEISARIVYDHSAEQYVDFVGTQVSSRFEAPIDRAVLGVFAELMESSGSGPVLDIGCGSGRIAAHFAERGLDAQGVDVSVRMIEAARSAHPALRFDVGTLTSLPVSTRSVGGAVYWYSIIATPPSALPLVWNELDRVLTDNGYVLLSFQAGQNDRDSRPDAYGSSTTLTLYHHSMNDVIESLGAAGFTVRVETLRHVELPHETTPQAFLIAERQNS